MRAGHGAHGTLGDGPPLGVDGAQLVEAPPQVPLLPAQVFFLDRVLPLLTLQVLQQTTSRVRLLQNQIDAGYRLTL